MAINTYLSITIINVNGVKAAIKRHMMADWIIIQECTIILLTRDPLQGNRDEQIESEGMENIFHVNGNDKKERATFRKKYDFKTKVIKTDKEGHYIITKGSLIQEHLNT